MLRRRLAAIAALALGLVALGLPIVLAIVDVRRGVLTLAVLALSLAAAWQGLVHRGASRVLGLGSGAVLAVVTAALLFSGEPGLVLVLVGAPSLALAAASYAFYVPVALPPAPRPAHPVLLFNPRSGGGKVERFHVPVEARARGIEPIELTPGTDLAQLVRRALDGGADALAMAGGDGSQAIVAGIAAERGLPYACIPAGRNHFALDLGVDPEDVVGALDALVDGSERRIDLGEVNGRAFVNNISLGVYGEAVQRAGYRGAKVRTVLDTLPDVLGAGRKPDLRWRGPEGDEHEGAAAIVVSNNRYRFERPPGAGARPRLADGVLGVIVLAAPGGDAPARTWTTPSFEVDARAPVPAASTARRSSSSRRSGSASGGPSCAAASPATIAAPRPRRSPPTGRGRRSARSLRSPAGGKMSSGRSAMFRIAHVSDLHVLSPRGVEWRRVLFNKRMTGAANLLLHRARVFRRDYLVAVLSGAAAWADHVVVTGDVTNLALEREFEEARTLLDALARRVEVTVVPGNHDVYLPSVQAKRRFPHHFGAFLRSDLPELARDAPAGAFPCVKLRGPVAIVALSSAVPRPPFVASGRVGEPQLGALRRILAHPEVSRRTAVVLVHHPPVDDRIRLRVLRDGLVDLERLRAALAPLPRGLVLFGHLHVRVHRSLRTAAGELDAFAASAAALDHPNPAVRAGFNAYTVGDDGGLLATEAHVVAPDGRTMDRIPLDDRKERT